MRSLGLLAVIVERVNALNRRTEKVVKTPVSAIRPEASAAIAHPVYRGGSSPIVVFTQRAAGSKMGDRSAVSRHGTCFPSSE